MTIKKTIVTTSSFLITAFLLSQIHSLKINNEHKKEINYSAFVNLAHNIQSVSTRAEIAPENVTALVSTEAIIKVIDNEINKKIDGSHYSIRLAKLLKKKAEILAEEKLKPVIKKEMNVNVAELSLYEINNSELINLYALNSEEITYQKFESSNIAYSSNDDIKDEVAVSQASTKSNQEIINDDLSTQQDQAISDKVPAKEDEEMVMFDYADKSAPAAVAKTMDQKLYERPISKTVQKAIDREMGSKPVRRLEAMNTQNGLSESRVKNIARIDNQDVDLNSDENIIYDYSKPKDKSVDEDNKSSGKVHGIADEKQVEDTQFIISAKEINLSTQKKRQLRTFEFIPDYDRAERSDDQGSGEIAFGYSLSGDMNTQTGTIQAPGMRPTRVELNLAKKATFEVLLINEDGMQKFLQKKGLSIEGNLILLAIDPSIADTEIDSKYAERFFFDNNFKSLSSSAGASLVMYAGVKTGNIMVRYQLRNKEVAEKIVYVGDGEMYFEHAEFTSSNRETYTLTTRNLMGQKRKELNIDGEQISFFNTNIKSKKKTLNAYDIKVPALVSGMRKYLEFTHLKDTVFVGTSSTKEIEIPNNDFIAKVLEMNQVSSLKDRCLVQINLSKDLRDFKVNGKNRTGEMYVETTYIDIDGNFSRDSFEKAEKAFIVGDLQGQFNVKLDYTDGSTEFLKTFCSENTYFVEQL